MRLSVVIPVYNVADYLQKCIDSVLANDCAGCELVLVDDGSTDGRSAAICDENAARRPDLIRVIHQENRGLGGARNTGLEAARGEYLFFVDSDDFITEDALGVLKAAVEESRADIYSFGFYSVDGAGNRTPVKTWDGGEAAFRLEERADFLLSLPAACVRVWRRSLFLNSGIRFPSRVWYEDIRTSPKLFALAESIVTLDRPLYCYLARPGSIMRSDNIARSREILDAFDDLLAWFREKGLYERYEKELCRLAVDHISLAACVRVARADPRSPLLAELSAYMEEHFPGYIRNPYLTRLPGRHKLLLKLLRGRHYTAVRLLFSLKERL